MRTQLDGVRAAAPDDPQQASSRVFQELARVVAGKRELIRLLQFGVLELGPALKPLYRKHLGDVIEAKAGSLLDRPEQAKFAGLHAPVIMLFLLATVIVVQNFYALFSGPAQAPSAEAITAACADVWDAVLLHGGLVRNLNPAEGSMRNTS